MTLPGMSDGSRDAAVLLMRSAAAVTRHNEIATLLMIPYCETVLDTPTTDRSLCGECGIPLYRHRVATSPVL